jgi:phosphoglycolate phosphatase-like HAD superfamily hydrolase
MKYGILSDIHANLEALSVVLEKCKDEGVEQYICLGDIVGYNANPSECLDLIRGLDLVACVNRRGLFDRMLLVQGNRSDAGGRKAAHLRRHLEELGADAGAVVMIGDSLDDAAAAAAVGSRCVLFNGGSHHREELEQTGVPVTNSLVDAVAVAARMPT